MANGQASGVKRFLLWDYQRATWQYDVMVALILAFIFLTPRSVFRDQPRPAAIAEIPSERGRAFHLDLKLLESVPEPDRKARAESALRSRYGKSISVERVEALRDVEQELTGFMAFTQP